MKTKLFLAASLIGVAALSARAGVELGISIAVPAPVVVVAPVVMVPEVYAWDGVENVGIVNGQYFYLGPGDVWLACDPGRLERFHGWEKGHADWQTHATRNDNYRKDAHGNTQPIRHDGPEKRNAQPVRDGRSEKGTDKAAPMKDDKH